MLYYDWTKLQRRTRLMIEIKELIDTNWNKYESALIILFVWVEVGDHTMDYTSLSLSLSLSVCVLLCIFLDPLLS